MTEISGRCLCAAVAFAAKLDDPEVVACHCGQCRRWSGHFWASVNVALATFRVTAGEDAVAWFRSSNLARRGFCRNCGSALFWHADGHADHAHRIALAAGAIEAASGLALKEHIFVADKGDYYEIADGYSQIAAY